MSFYSETSHDYSNYGSGGGGFSYGQGHHGHLECCPLVVDPLTYIALVGGILAATFFSNQLITMNIMIRKRRRRDTTVLGSTFTLH